jgi:hypothetical protein
MRRALAILASVVAAIALCSARMPAQATAPPAAAPAPVGPEQPIQFSHAMHAGTMKMPCEYCHVPSRTGDTLIIPRADMCMQCHRTMDTGNPEVQKLAQYAKSGSIIPWVRVYELPSFVTFSHKRHLEHGLTCQDCHGDVAREERVARVTDISMGGCMSCHRAKHASLGCNTCHFLQQ